MHVKLKGVAKYTCFSQFINKRAYDVRRCIVCICSFLLVTSICHLSMYVWMYVCTCICIYNHRLWLQIHIRTENQKRHSIRFPIVRYSLIEHWCKWLPPNDKRKIEYAFFYTEYNNDITKNVKLTMTNVILILHYTIFCTNYTSFEKKWFYLKVS